MKEGVGIVPAEVTEIKTQPIRFDEPERIFADLGRHLPYPVMKRSHVPAVLFMFHVFMFHSSPYPKIPRMP
jgi:hypothetical protein